MATGGRIRTGICGLMVTIERRPGSGEDVHDDSSDVLLLDDTCHGRSRWNRTITAAGMGRAGALHWLRCTGTH